MATFLTATEGDRLNAIYTVMCTTGLRRGEALGLRWQDVDTNAARLQVTQTLTSNNYKIEFGRPKTAKSVRSVALDLHTVTVLRAWRKAQLEERLGERLPGQRSCVQQGERRTDASAATHQAFPA